MGKFKVQKWHHEDYLFISSYHHDNNKLKASKSLSLSHSFLLSARWAFLNAPNQARATRKSLFLISISTTTSTPDTTLEVTPKSSSTLSEFYLPDTFQVCLTQEEIPFSQLSLPVPQLEPISFLYWVVNNSILTMSLTLSFVLQSLPHQLIYIGQINLSIIRIISATHYYPQNKTLHDSNGPPCNTPFPDGILDTVRSDGREGGALLATKSVSLCQSRVSNLREKSGVWRRDFGNVVLGTKPRSGFQAFSQALHYPCWVVLKESRGMEVDTKPWLVVFIFYYYDYKFSILTHTYYLSVSVDQKSRHGQTTRGPACCSQDIGWDTFSSGV